MSWSRSAEYTPVPTSSSTLSSPLEPSPPLDFPTRSQSQSRWRKAYIVLGACTALIAVGSLFIVPEEALPTKVSSAVGASWEAFEAAKTSWGWQTQEEMDEEIEELKDDIETEELTEGSEKVESEGDDVEEIKVEGMEDLETTQKSALKGVECSDETKKLMGDPEFWTVKAPPTSTSYSIVPRNPLPSNIPQACISQAVFSARLVSFTDSLTPSPSSETLYALTSPSFSPTYDSFDIVIPSDLKIPKQQYELQVTLEFGFFPGATEGNCGSSEKVCQEAAISEVEGEQLEYIGKQIEIEEEVKFVGVGTPLESEASLPLCTDLSSLDGYWWSLSYNPITPAPCFLFNPSFPTPFIPPTTEPETEKQPLWIHFVGDSNTRNMYSQFLNSLGNGHKISALKVMDSKTHNGTHASFASRWSSGQIPTDDSLPDFIVTWSWWYQSIPVEPEALLTQEEVEVAWNENLQENRDDLLRLVDTNLADYLLYAKLGAATKGNPILAKIGPTLRPHRTYLSLGSHSERLSVPGSIASLDFLLDETNGLSHSKRDSSNLRIFTTTHVNPTYIPLDRFPHQDLVRNNAFISAKNSLTRSRPEFTESISPSNGGRILNIEALTRGITVDAEWMKPGKNGRSPDAVHFREEVYNEWVRVVWTDLVQGVDVSLESKGAVRRKWKKSRIEDWDDEEEF
ncbi:hypothetical protein JCM3765_006192 [Sporobolomyces pararoseus]